MLGTLLPDDLVGGSNREFIRAPACSVREERVLNTPALQFRDSRDEPLAILKRWASRYTPDESVADRIAQRAAWLAATDPDMLDTSNLKRSLMIVLHRIALEEIEDGPVLSKGSPTPTASVWGRRSDRMVHRRWVRFWPVAVN
jgi:hypothetical protein